MTAANSPQTVTAASMPRAHTVDDSALPEPTTLAWQTNVRAHANTGLQAVFAHLRKQVRTALGIPRRADRPASAGHQSSEPHTPRPATVTRPDWSDLPQTVRDTINARSHQPVIEAQPAKAGFTATFAATLTHADHSLSFAKAAPPATAAAAAHHREATIAARLPLAVPSARLRWHTQHAGWQISVFDAVDGHVPEPGWSVRHAEPVIAAWQQATTALTSAGTALRWAARRPHPLPTGWADIAAGRQSLPPHAAHLAALVPQMRAWEHEFVATCDTATTLAHFDLRPDNLLINDMGQVWIIDWARLQPAPPYTDAAILAIAASDDGTDPQAFFDTAAPGTPGEHLDHLLAWLAGTWLTNATGPYLRAHYLRQGLLTWQWLALRHDLPGVHVPAAEPRPCV